MIAGRPTSSSTLFDFNIYDVLSGPFLCRGGGSARLHSTRYKRNHNAGDQRGENEREKGSGGVAPYARKSVRISTLLIIVNIQSVHFNIYELCQCVLWIKYHVAESR